VDPARQPSDTWQTLEVLIMATPLPLYRGFSTANFIIDRKKGFMLTNQELVKQDLLNFIYTIPGERMHLPSFGTRIPLLAFEPLDEKTISIVREDLTKAVTYDPRLQLVDMAVQGVPAQNMIIAFVDLRYLELDVTETLKLEFGVGA
jgi:phage baseplate assembly protein W